ncbi:MAG: ARMT1-like domain-containing protein [Crenarchaeota archaeon]|nr:ARMT1-like domain-containing protein [Thermoproteota archaeon]
MLVKPGLLCIPCTVNAALDIASKATDDPNVIKKILLEVLKWLPEAFEKDASPNILHSEVCRVTQKLTGVRDPFKHVKTVSNETALKVYPSLCETVKSIRDNVEALRFCLKAAIIGNMMDFEVHGHRFSLESLESRFKNYLKEPLVIDDVDKLCEEITRAKKILYLADNAGEIVFDKLVAKCLKERWGCAVTMVVKGGPVLNDATLEDAEHIRLGEACDKTITTGDDTIGIVMSKVSEEFKQTLNDSDIVISKGQGNFESLTGLEKNIGKPVCYILRVKCEVVGRNLGVPKDSNVVKLIRFQKFRKVY